MKDFFKGSVFRALLALLAFAVLALMVWFLGPFLALGETRPFESVGIRVSTILLLLAGLLGWVLNVTAIATWAIIGAAALSLLLWHAGPLLGLGPWYPFAALWARILCILLLWLGLLAWGLYKLYKALQKDDKLLQHWLHKGEPAKPALAKEEVRHLSQRAKQTLAQLRQMHLSMNAKSSSLWSVVRRVIEGKRYLYELPWFVLIGQPGAGKSSIVLNAGLKFPLPEQMGAASARLMLEQATGTQQCDWWLTNEAVFLDTAGRYTEQDSGSSEEAKLSNAAEWRGFLGVLRQVRPRAPVNAALLVVDTAQLLQSNAQSRLLLASQMRARLEELRSQLGIRFPVYVLLAKADVLRGFTAYFSSLTHERRAQVWGFTLPWQGDGHVLHRLSSKMANKPAEQRPHTPNTTVLLADPPAGLLEQVSTEYGALVERIRSGVIGRLQEEFELDQRQSLYLLPYEMQALQEPLEHLVEAVFAPSRFDNTQLGSMLRGVYLTSALQTSQELSTQTRALSVRLRLAFAKFSQSLTSAVTRNSKVTSRKSFFLTDLMQRVIFAESHLVKPNLLWETRMRLLRWIGHGLVLVVFMWLWSAMSLSHSNNQGYLQEVTQKTDVLATQLQQWMKDKSPAQTENVLNLTRQLPMHAGLDLNSPELTYRYGLYSAEGVARAAHTGYDQMLDRVVLPSVITHMEQAMQEAVLQKDARRAYDTLRAYLLLHDRTRYEQDASAARDVRLWVTQEWQRSSVSTSAQARAEAPAPAQQAQPGKNATSAAVAQTLSQRLGNSAAMVGHLEWLFSGRRPVQASTTVHEERVRQVRDFLSQHSSTERLYERAKSAMADQAPRELSLSRVLGPQANALLTRASGGSLDKGVPGLFTYEGYHNIFSKQLPKMLDMAQLDDAWVMGRVQSESAQEKKSTLLSSSEKRELVEDVRRQYLQEYSGHWDALLNDIRLVNNNKSATLAFEINIVRQLAAADSPLVKLARLAARETTLSRPLVLNSEDKSFFDRASEQLDQQQNQVEKGLGVRPEQRLERQYVDERFSALREVVVGPASGGASTPAAGQVSLETMNNALNEYYTVLVVADTALAAGSMPPSVTDASLKLSIEAGKLPAPLRAVVQDVSSRGADKAAQGASSILRTQAQAQMDRLSIMMSLNVSEPCRRQIAGRYPFANSAQEVSADDFNAFFANGGAADSYFRKYMLPLVDTGARPWRYKSPQSANLLIGPDGLAQGQTMTAAVTGPTLQGELLKLLAESGPDPDAFAQIAQIRDMFFREAEGKRMSWRGDYRVISLDAGITEWTIDIDGQVQRYAHGPIQNIPIQWPGPRTGVMAELHASPRVKADTSSISVRGPWAWLRLIERGQIAASSQTGRQTVEFSFDNRRAVLEIGSQGASPFGSAILRNFTCPGSARK